MSDCLNNIPYASVVGCIFCIVGAGVMGGTLWEALQLTDEKIVQKLFLMKLDWILYIRIGVISVCSFVALLAVFLIIFGYLATKATRQHLYHEDVCTMGGRCTACCCLSIMYLLSILWVILFAISCLPVISWLGLVSICDHNAVKMNAGVSFMFNLENYGIYAPMLPPGARSNLTNLQDVEQLCITANYIGPLFISSLGGTLLVILGLWLTVSAVASLRLRLKLAKELVAAKQGFETNEEHGEELQSFLVQNARISSGYQQPAQQNVRLTEDGSSQQFAAQPSPAQFDPAASTTRYLDLTQASSSQFDRSKAASPTVVGPGLGTTQFDARTNSKNGTLQYDQRSVQQSQFDRISIQQQAQAQAQAQAQYDQRAMLQQPQFDQRSIQQYDTRSQQQYAAAAYAQQQQQQMPGSQSGSMGGGTGSQLNMHPSNMAHHQAMINAVGNNQMGMVNAANYYASLSRGANAGRPDMPMQTGTLPSYTAAVHGGYVQANANIQMGMHDVNAYQLGGNDMNATGASIDEEDVDADWNMQMNVNMMKH